MIPKVIHYCWFGGNPLPKYASECIQTWRKLMPDYEIKEWNEQNFDVNSIPYTREAYAAKKYAFVSDYARFWILYHYGGVYFDTDVRMVKSPYHIIEKGPFMGFEQPDEVDKLSKDPFYYVAPGLGIGVEAHNAFFAELLKFYQQRHFIDENGKNNMTTVVQFTTDLLRKQGLHPNNQLQQVAGIWIYPWDYFCPQSFYTKKMNSSANTVSVHLYSESWNPFLDILKRRFCRMLGDQMSSRLVRAKRKTLSWMRRKS